MHDVPSNGRNNSALFRPTPPVIRTAKVQMLTSYIFRKNFLLPSSSSILIVVVVVDVDVVVVVEVVVPVVVVEVVDVDVDVVVVEVVVAVVFVVDVIVLVVVVEGCIPSSPDRQVVTMSSSRTSPPPVLTSHPLHCDRGHRTYLSCSLTRSPL